MTAGLAIFVKTPGLSNVKTRLAQDMSKTKAQDFYMRSVNAVEGVAATVKLRIPSLHIYWAIAERAGLSRQEWSRFPTLFQGTSDGLGKRLHNIYDLLLKKHGIALLIGSDCPLISERDIEKALHLLSQHSFVLGKCQDGGFYLFGGTQPIPESLWKSVPYSVSETAAILENKLTPHGTVSFLSPRFDVDTREDLQKLAATPLENLTKFQREIVVWAKHSLRESGK